MQSLPVVDDENRFFGFFDYRDIAELLILFCNREAAPDNANLRNVLSKRFIAYANVDVLQCTKRNLFLMFLVYSQWGPQLYRLNSTHRALNVVERRSSSARRARHRAVQRSSSEGDAAVRAGAAPPAARRRRRRAPARPRLPDRCSPCYRR